MPLTLRVGVFKEAMEKSFPDAPGHEGMIRKVNLKTGSIWMTPEQVAAEYEQNTGRKMTDPVDRAKQWMTVKPNDQLLSVNRNPRSLTKEIIAGTVVAGAVVTAPLWGPRVLRAAPEAAKAAEEANRVRVVVEEGADLVVGQKVRVAAEEGAVELIEDMAQEAGQQVLRMFLDQ
jgi:hypothetical protein